MSIKGLSYMPFQSVPFHPFLVVVFQVLTIYAVNVNKAHISAVMFVFLMALIIFALFFLLFSFLTKDVERAAIVVTFYCFLFFTYGRLHDFAYGLSIFDLVIGSNKFLLPLYALLIIAGPLWIFHSQWCKKYLDKMTYFLNIFSLGLVLVAALVAITNFDWITFGSKKHIEPKYFSINKEAHQVSQRRNKILHPNVYFIIMDSYASHRVLKKYYNWDDIDVVDALRLRGFSVYKNACSNYPFTILSIGSTLNMRYIHEDRGFIDANSKSSYLSHHFEQNMVMERFKSEGYDVVSGIDHSPNNINKVYNSYITLYSDQFTYLVVRASILRIFEYELTADVRRNDILTKLEHLKLLDVPKKPTFVYSHILCPHPPYIFNADGSKPTLFESTLRKFDNKNGYLNQARFIGTRIIEVVDHLRSRDPTAVIIVQADHGNGSILGDYLFMARQKPPVEFLDAQYGILSAIYLPPGIRMPEKFTPVNLFRCLFNTLFNAKLDVLPDKAFFTKVKEPYVFFEVTNDLNLINKQY